MDAHAEDDVGPGRGRRFGGSRGSRLGVEDDADAEPVPARLRGDRGGIGR